MAWLDRTARGLFLTEFISAFEDKYCIRFASLAEAATGFSTKIGIPMSINVSK